MEQSVNGKPKKSAWKIIIIIVSVINIIVARFSTVVTIPYPVGVFTGDISEFVVLALILGMSIASLAMAKDKSKAGFILAFGVAILLLLFAPFVVPVVSPPFIIFGIQGILYVVAAAMIKKETLSKSNGDLFSAT